MIRKQLLLVIQQGVRETGSICWTLFKFMLPISLIVRILTVLEWISPLAGVLSPFMRVLGLPSEMSLVWMSALLTGIYGGIAALSGVVLDVPLTVAQMTVLAVVMLFAHAFPVELAICRQAGFRVLPMFVIRFGMALLTGAALNVALTLGGWLQGPAMSFWTSSSVERKTWQAWAVGESLLYAKIFLIVLTLVFFLRFFRYVGGVAILETLMRPLLRRIGLSVDAVPVLMVGILLGISYGGGLIVNEAKSGVLSGRDLALSLILMSLAHAVIEDTIVLQMTGASVIGILWVRVVLALMVVFVLGAILRRYPAWVRFFQKEVGGAVRS